MVNARLPIFGSYASELGLAPSVASKLVSIGQAFFSEKGIPAWDSLPEAAQRELSVERLYIAAGIVRSGRWTPEQAVSEAVVHPPAWLRAERDGTEPLDERPCICPTCGRRHWSQSAR